MSPAHRKADWAPAPPAFTGVALTPFQLNRLWTAYLADHGNQELRNRLVEHYAPWVFETARATAAQMAFLDRENAVSEIMAALVESIVPGYNGFSGFKRYARPCIKRKLIDQQRKDQPDDALFAAQFQHGYDFAPDRVPDPEQKGCDLNFLELTAELSDVHATVLWLTHYRRTPVEEVAAMLHVSRRTVCSRLREALAALKRKWGDRPKEQRPMHC